MPTKLRDNSPERRRDEKRQPKSERERSDKRERTHRSSSHRKASTRDKTSSRTSISSTESKRKPSMPEVSEESSELLTSESRANLPYPSFSRAHSKEAVGSHPSLNVFTPPATDVDGSKDKPTQPKAASLQNGPPSPPLTDKNVGRPRTTNVRTKTVDTIPEEEKKDAKDVKFTTTLRQKSSRSNGHLRSTSDIGTSLSPTKSRERASTPLKNVKNMESSNKPPQRSVSQPTRTASPTTSPTATEVTVNDSSDATSIAPEQPSIQRPGSKVLQTVMTEDAQSRPKSAVVYPSPRQQTPVDIFVGSPGSQHSVTSTAGPPPPPPPPVMPQSIPKVDYLLQNGGLNQPIPKNLLHAGKPMAVQYASTTPDRTQLVIAHLFEPYNTLLEDFEKVVSKNGSLAVATGYRSVARRLLDRLEAVFARDISSEECKCCMCVSESPSETSSGVSWGEILELVSGRRDLPNWPPFTFVQTPSGLGISLDIEAPMQKVDIDVPEEYREHYIRQSRKTKQSVDKWLSRQADDPSSPPEEADDETLTFAILTHLPAGQRPVFKRLVGIVDKPLGPPRRAPSPDSQGAPKPVPTPQPRNRSETIVNAGLAIQRLYRLHTPPRDAETGIFLLNNLHMHNALATLAAISNDEWDILISGRFDGFLRSGAEDPLEQINGRNTPARVSSRGPSRGPTPHIGQSRQGSYVSRQTTPAPHYGAPIALDEDAEIATLAEIERDIYTGMEALEDAFEALHQKAEGVRRALRERSAGLAAAAQRRRGNSISNVEVRMGTPASGVADRWETETDDGLGDWDGISEIAPDDSASNISSARRRRPKRRNERRTPAMIDEEDEEDFAESERSISPEKR